MKQDENELAALTRALTPGVVGPHPAAEELVQYEANELGAKRADEIQEHLVECRECARVVLDLARFPDIEPARESYRLTRREAQDQAGALLRHVRAESEKRRSPWWRRLLDGLMARDEPGSHLRVAWATAVGAVVVAAVLGFQLLDRRPSSQDLSGPLVGFPVVLEPTEGEGDLYRSVGPPPDSGQVTEVPAGFDAIVLRVMVPFGAGEAPYRVRVLDRDRRVLRDTGPIARMVNHSLDLLLPIDSWTGAGASVEVYATVDGASRKVATYSVPRVKRAD